MNKLVVMVFVKKLKFINFGSEINEQKYGKLCSHNFIFSI